MVKTGSGPATASVVSRESFRPRFALAEVEIGSNPKSAVSFPSTPAWETHQLGRFARGARCRTGLSSPRPQMREHDAVSDQIERHQHGRNERPR
jgi:hypothetical protein